MHELSKTSETPPGEITVKMNVLIENRVAVSTALDRLRSRLEWVLPESLGDPPSVMDEVSPLTPLGSALEKEIQELWILVQRINALADRVEL
jgi:hypothetical protein